jgi:hypothetical protein
MLSYDIPGQRQPPRDMGTVSARLLHTRLEAVRYP